MNCIFRSSFLILIFFWTAIIGAQTPEGGNEPYFSKNPTFIKNNGQLVDQHGHQNAEVLYLLNTPGLNVQLRASGFSYDVYEREKSSLPAKPGPLKEFHKKLLQDAKKPSVKSKFHRIDIDFLGASPNVKLMEYGRAKATTNYYNIADVEEGITNVSAFKKIIYVGLYPNIDLEFFIPEDKSKPVEYNFIIHPHGKMEDIQIKVAGAKTRLLSGSLEMELAHGKMTETIPASWLQENEKKSSVEVQYFQLEENLFGFCYSEENKNTNNATLTIDPTPVRQWATYFGGEDVDSSNLAGLGTDSDGNVIIAGVSRSHTNIATSGRPESLHESDAMAYLAKFDSDGRLLWSIYYGGYRGAAFYDLALDSEENIVAIGATNSENNIATPGAHQTSILNAFNHGSGIMVKFDKNGNRIWGTYYGGDSADYFLSVVVDANDNIYAGGATGSNNNIATADAFRNAGDLIVHFNTDAFLVKMNPEGVRQWATYYGGDSHENINSLALDSRGNILLAGDTGSMEGIATPGTYQDIYAHGGYSWNDAFVAKISPTGQLLWGTYFGGWDYDFGNGVTVDNEDNVILTGITRNSDDIASPGAHQEIKGGDSNTFNAFLAKFTSEGQLHWSTFYGGLGGSGGTAVKVAANNDIFMAGSSGSETNISTTGSYQPSLAGSSDVFLAKFNATGQRVWGTYYGGEWLDETTNMALTLDGTIYIIGRTFSTTGISTPGAYQEEKGGADDAFLVKFKDCLTGISAEAPAGVCEGEDIEFTASGGISYLWTGPNGFSSTSPNPVIPAAAPGDSGTYNVFIVSGTDCDDTRTFEILVSPSPVANSVNDVTACEEELGSGISSQIDLSQVESQLLGSQTGMEISYYTEDGYFIANTLPNPYTNTTTNKETLIGRVAIAGNTGCYAETRFDIIIAPNPSISSIEDLITCDTDTDGIAATDLRPVSAMLAVNNSDLSVSYLNENGIPVVLNAQGSYTNSKPFQETLTARLTRDATGCYSEMQFDLVINPIAVAHPLQERIGCDDDNDGISEYFDLSELEAEVLQGQTGFQVSYFRSDDSEITGMTSPYTNLQPYEETLWVRVGDPLTGCYAETPLTLKTSAAPALNTPVTMYSCDAGFGIGSFDTSAWNQNIIGNQTGLKITYYNQNGNELPTPLPAVYRNVVPNSEKITVKVENELNSLCVSETSFDLIINENQELILQETYNLCDLEPFLNLKPGGNFDTWEWSDSNGIMISNTAEASLTAAGNYSVTVSKTENGVTCESSYAFRLIRSQLPVITEVKYQEWSSSNYIEIMSGDDGGLEYSIDGVNFQDSNYFGNIPGGTYTVFARDRMGCGMASAEVVLIDYPKYFTPNNDGYNDLWQIKGVATQTETHVLIFDRYGKLLKQISSHSLGWDGSFNGKMMPADDYWFSIALEDGKIFKGHFSLIR